MKGNALKIAIGIIAVIIIVLIIVSATKKKPKAAPPGSGPTGPTGGGAPASSGATASGGGCNVIDNFGDVSNTNADLLLSQGSQGAEVAALQRILNYKFSACLNVDGHFGSQTAAELARATGKQSISLNQLFNINTGGTSSAGSYGGGATSGSGGGGSWDGNCWDLLSQEMRDFCEWNPLAIFYSDCYCYFS